MHILLRGLNRKHYVTAARFWGIASAADVSDAYNMPMPGSITLLLAILCPVIVCMAQAPRTPDVEAQRTAMKKLSFLIGKWSGDASLLRNSRKTGRPAPLRVCGVPPLYGGAGKARPFALLRTQGRFVDLSQTEEAQFKLDGLVLMIEGVGRTKVDGKLCYRRWD